MSNYELSIGMRRGDPRFPIHGLWGDMEHIPINDPSLPLIIENSVKKALSEKDGSRETISLLKEIKEQLQVIATEIKTLKPFQREELIVFRDITRDDAKQEIKKYFKAHHGEPIGYSDLVRDLNLDLKVIVELCSELENEGIIA
jgi:hypothetical protein